MRLLHPRTIEILASHTEFPKTHLAHAWSEVFKYLASGQKHPKMFLPSKRLLGQYLAHIYVQTDFGELVNLDRSKVDNMGGVIVKGWEEYFSSNLPNEFEDYFDSNYLFSDACSLYYKGINIFPDIFGDEWEKYCPVISLKEINRQVDKTLNK